jgi:hypothetical protein
VKFPSVFVGFLLVTAVWAQATPIETGWRASVRPWVIRVFGEAKATNWLGAPPVAVESIILPVLPALDKKNTDVSVYKREDSELRKQGKEFEALSVDKRRAYDVAFLQEVFLVTRRAPAKNEDLAKWDNVLEGGGSREGIYRGLVLDEVYASLENYEEAPSAKLIEWTLNFARSYLGLAFQAEAFQKANLFFLKRHMSEKALEMMDMLESKPQDFRSWYAVYSSDIAQAFPILWGGHAIRGVSDRKAHFAWASKAPLQHIKLEAVIKLHMVMNHLQDTP